MGEYRIEGVNVTPPERRGENPAAFFCPLDMATNGPTIAAQTRIQLRMKPNDEQLAIITAPEAKTLVLAAAGSGKTRVLIWRIKHAIENGMRPNMIVAITFTNVAADELTARLAKEGIKIQFVGTLHAYALRQITLHGQCLGYRGIPTLISEEDAIAERKAIIKALRVPASTSLEAIDAAIGTKGSTNAHLVAMAYRKKLRAENKVDFTTILAEFETLLVMNPFLVLDALFVDEYQDSGARDVRIYELIHAEMDFRVGDVSQSMYSFRGGDVRNIQELAKVRATYRLGTNYRSANAIIGVANSLMMGQPGFEPMATAREEVGIVTLKEYPNVATEAASIAAFIRHSGRPDSDFAVLTRFNARAKAIRDALTAEGVAVKQITRPTLEPRTMAVLERMAEAQIITGSLGEALAANGLSMDEIRAVNDGWKGSLLETIQGFKLAEEAAIGEGVHVGTVHSLKGGERPVVFVAGMEAHTWPGKKKGDELAEERRIAYVAFTRARDELHVSWSRTAPDSAGFGLVQSIASPFTACME